jgi:hypothetical protein
LVVTQTYRGASGRQRSQVLAPGLTAPQLKQRSPYGIISSAAHSWHNASPSAPQIAHSGGAKMPIIDSKTPKTYSRRFKSKTNCGLPDVKSKLAELFVVGKGVVKIFVVNNKTSICTKVESSVILTLK